MVGLPFHWVFALLFAAQAAGAAERVVVLEYLRQVSPEAPATRELRHQRVSMRRKGPVVMVHRGAAAFAPENSLAACAAAMDYGGDGCEVDLRRTRDGVLILFHDDTLDRVTDGLGRMNQVTYRETQSLRSRRVGGRPLFSPPPTFAALLDLACERAMLLHLDLKEPGLEAEVERLLESADAWDQVVAVNGENAPALSRDPRLKLLQYKAPGLYAGRLDLDPAAVETALQQTGQMILVDDPRVATRVLRRAPFRPEPYTKTYRVAALPPLPLDPGGAHEIQPVAYLRWLTAQPQSGSTDRLVALVEGASPGRTQAEELAPETAPTGRILTRAWAAQRLVAQGRPTRQAVAALEQRARAPTLHADWAYDGLDAAQAVRALGDLRVAASASFVVELFENPPPGASGAEQFATAGTALTPAALKAEVRNDRMRSYILQALGELRSRASKRFLGRYVTLSETEARRFGEPQFEEATRALLRQRLAWDEIAVLLRSSNSAVRGTALAECLDHYTEERGLALRSAARWALDLPRARH